MTPPRVAIIGGGITGLAAAWELQKHGVDYTLFEASNRLGGKIVTEHIDGFTIEGGPDSFLSSKPWAWHLCDELGLRERMIGTNDAQRNVYILKGGKLHPYPKGMRLIVPVEEDGLLASELLSEEGKRRMLAEVELQPYDAPADESLASFVRRHFGQEALDVFAEPLLAGIYIGDPETMSIRATYPQYVEMERTHGSLIRAIRSAPSAVPDPLAPKTAFFSLKGGTQELVDTLASRLTGTIGTDYKINEVKQNQNTFDLDGWDFETLIVTSDGVDSLLKRFGTNTMGYRRFIGRHSISVSLGYRKSDMPHELDGYGFVVPYAESTYLQACTWSSTKILGRAPLDHVLIRVFLGWSKDTALFEKAAIYIAREELQKIMGIDAMPVVEYERHWSNPQYHVGHLEWVEQLESLCPAGLFLAGSSYRGVGVPDCIHQGQVAAQKAIAYLGGKIDAENP